MKKLVVFLLSFSFLLHGQETWNPAQNPASLTRQISGFTEPCATLSIKAEYAGRLEIFLIKEGEVLDGDNDRILIASQESRLAAIEVERLTAALKSQQKSLLKRQSEKKLLEREVTYRLLEVKRIENLVKDSTVTKSEFDRVKFDYDMSVLKVTDIDNSIMVQRQAIEQSKVALEKAEEDLSRFKLYAPKGWVLNERAVEPGTWLNGGETVAKFVDLRELSVFIRLSEEEVESLNDGLQKLTLKRSGKEITARVHHIDLAFDPVSRKRLVEFRVNTSEFPLSSGTEVQLKVDIPYPKPAVRIPKSYVFSKLDQEYVKSTEGTEIALIPLRRTKDSIIVNKSALPDKVTLVKPQNK